MRRGEEKGTYSDVVDHSYLITGRRMCISRQGMGRISVFLRFLTGKSIILIHFKHGIYTFSYLPCIRDLFNDKYTGKTTGGFVVYYVSGGKGDVTAFKPVSSPACYHSDTSC